MKKIFTNMKKYLLKQDLFNHKAGEEVDVGTEYSFNELNHGFLSLKDIDIYTRLGVLEEIDGEEELRFTECDTCRAKAGSPVLCRGCYINRTLISKLGGKV